MILANTESSLGYVCMPESTTPISDSILAHSSKCEADGAPSSFSVLGYTHTTEIELVGISFDHLGRLFHAPKDLFIQHVVSSLLQPYPKQTCRQIEIVGYPRPIWGMRLQQYGPSERRNDGHSDHMLMMPMGFLLVSFWRSHITTPTRFGISTMSIRL